MGNMLRWSEEDLKKHLSKNGTTSLVKPQMAIVPKPAIPDPVTQKTSLVSEKQDAIPPKKKKSSAKKKLEPVNGDLFQETNPPEKKKKKQSSAIDRVKQASASIKLAKVTGVQVQGKYIEFTFDGARLLSLNDMYALSHFQRVDYRKAWHDAMYEAVLQITGGPRHLFKFEQFHIQAHRVSTQYCDMDALIISFKYAIDGLRYANIIEDDDPKHMVSIAATQEKGPHKIRIRVQRVDNASMQPRAISMVDDDTFEKTRPQ